MRREIRRARNERASVYYVRVFDGVGILYCKMMHR